MSDRFSKLFALPENLYSVGSPVVISAGALLKDNQTGKVLVQLKIKNISTKIIKALKVLIVPLDTTNSPLGEPFEYQYLDLDVHRDVEFGQKVPIVLPDSHSRGFTVSVNQAIFTDNSIWNTENPTWEPLNKPETIDSHINNTELVKQFHIRFSNQCQYMLSEQKDIWICPCGSLNHSSESACRKCNNKFSDFKNINWDSLKEEANKRVAEEKAELEKAKEVAEREAKYRKQREIQKQKRNRRIIYCAVLIFIAFVFLKTAIIPGAKYFNAVSLMESGKYEEAVTAFAELGDFADSSYKIEETKTLEMEARYNNAILLMEQGDYSEAIKQFRELKDFKDTAEKIGEIEDLLDEEKYNTAVSLMNSGDIVKAYQAFLALSDYKDSKEKANSLYDGYKLEKLKSINVGSSIVMGSYEQNNNTSDGTEDIRWRVLEMKDGKALVVSEYILDGKQYSTSDKNITWETSSLRKWLNGTFLNSAFSDAEKKIILTTTVSADKHPKYNTKQGNNTQDNVFLLSVAEANKYFSGESSRRCSPTSYTRNQFYLNSYPWTYQWLLRTIGYAQDSVSFVDEEGKIQDYLSMTDAMGVRPAMWISLEE